MKERNKINKSKTFHICKNFNILMIRNSNNNNNKIRNKLNMQKKQNMIHLVKL